jgi:hypothetical protein
MHFSGFRFDDGANDSVHRWQAFIVPTPIHGVVDIGAGQAALAEPQ